MFFPSSLSSAPRAGKQADHFVVPKQAAASVKRSISRGFLSVKPSAQVFYERSAQEVYRCIFAGGSV